MAAANLEAGLPGGSGRNNNIPICIDHGEVQNLFCTICVKGVCYRCIIESHNGHPLDYLSIASARGLAVRNALSWEMEDTINELTIGNRQVDRIQKTLKGKVESAKMNIKDYIKRCHTALDKREQDLLRRLSQAHTEKKALLEQQQHQIEERLKSLLKSYDKLQNQFSLEDPVMQAGLNSEALGELNTSREIPLTPATCDRLHFWRDFSMAVRMRHHLGILEVGENLVHKQEEDRGYYSPDSDAN